MLVEKRKTYKWCGHMELALFTLMHGVSVPVLTNINKAIETQVILAKEKTYFLFYPGTKGIYDTLLWSNERYPTVPYDQGITTDHFGGLC
jgi:hypothetical protein